MTTTSNQPLAWDFSGCICVDSHIGIPVLLGANEKRKRETQFLDDVSAVGK